MPLAESAARPAPGRRLPFSVDATDPGTSARAGALTTPHGVVRTPAFMPVGTAGTVKGITGWQLEDLAPQMVLANTYHLLLRPGVERLGRLGGLHRLMGWKGPILTDSGGYQVFSLAGRRKVTDDGVTFQSHLDGSRHELTPESVLDAQMTFGVDVAMVLDECLAYPPDPAAVGPSVDRTLRWARRAADHLRRRHEEGHSWRGGAFGIQQGAVDAGQRRRCTDALVELPFDGFAVGGLAVGEPSDVLHESIAACAPMLPQDRIRYLMGVGYPEDLVHAVGCGVDLFDCVLPTRSARTGKVFTSWGDLVIKHARWADDDRPLDPDCACPTCARYSRAALRHFFVSREATSVVLLTVHNLHFYLSLMRSAREAIIAGRYDGFREGFARARARGADDGGSEK
ncbi:MAG: tRNA guanosine(34) transglycosylase Tgt [Oceanicaulis sp.]|jgi:queuine tRNA-ribosyltransferase|nr:tRNA guanosine(34) transglycosylase Tgt [Oceanicaulis sp.]